MKVVRNVEIDKMLKADYKKFALDAEKTLKDTLVLVDNILGDANIGIAAMAVKAAVEALIASGNISIAAMLVIIGAIEGLVNALEADQLAKDEAMTVVKDLLVLKEDLGL